MTSLEMVPLSLILTTLPQCQPSPLTPPSSSTLISSSLTTPMILAWTTLSREATPTSPSQCPPALLSRHPSLPPQLYLLLNQVPTQPPLSFTRFLCHYFQRSLHWLLGLPYRSSYLLEISWQSSPTPSQYLLSLWRSEGSSHHWAWSPRCKCFFSCCCFYSLELLLVQHWCLQRGCSRSLLLSRVHLSLLWLFILWRLPSAE